MYNVVSVVSSVTLRLNQKLGQSRCTSLGIGARLAMLALSSRLSKGSLDAIAAAEEAL